jgi:crossover junction endodeoxyribonuclease RuvC
MTLFVGIDPGLSGAVSFRSDDNMSVEPMPTLKISKGKGAKRILDLNALARLIDNGTKNASRVHVFIERVASMPKQGVASMFAFGETYGAIKGIVAAHFLPMTLVTPVAWKSKLKVSSNKDDARYRASQLMPRHTHLWPRHKDDGLAEASLIAFYGQNFGGIA